MALLNSDELDQYFEAQGTGRKFWYIKQVADKDDPECYELCRKKDFRVVKKDLAAHVFECMNGILPVFDWK